MNDEAKSELRDEAVELWFKLTKTGFKTQNVLTYSLISLLTSLSIETVRRHVKKLEDNKWVYYSKKEGVKYGCRMTFHHRAIRVLQRRQGSERWIARGRLLLPAVPSCDPRIAQAPGSIVASRVPSFCGVLTQSCVPGGEPPCAR